MLEFKIKIGSFEYTNIEAREQYLKLNELFGHLDRDESVKELVIPFDVPGEEIITGINP